MNSLTRSPVDLCFYVYKTSPTNPQNQHKGAITISQSKLISHSFAMELPCSTYRYSAPGRITYRLTAPHNATHFELQRMSSFQLRSLRLVFVFMHFLVIKQLNSTKTHIWCDGFTPPSRPALFARTETQLPHIIIEAFSSVGTLVVDPGGTVHCRHGAPFFLRSSQRAFTPK